MEKPLKLVRMLSLKEIGIRIVSALLCKNSGIVDFFTQYNGEELTTTGIKEWLKGIGEKMLDLELPESLKKQIIDYVPKLGYMIRKWEIMHMMSFQLSLDDINLVNQSNLCWTTLGAIDYKKTAERIVACRLLRVELRYRIACFYCLENYIPLLWEDLPEWVKESCTELGKRPFLEYCWALIQKGEQFMLNFLWRDLRRNLTSFNQLAFEDSALQCNQAASEYFFQRLTPEEREASLVRAAYSVLGNLKSFCWTSKGLSDVLCYLLSLMTPEQQMGIVMARPVDILLCFLDWKQQELFSENARLLWTFVTPSSYDHLLFMVSRICEGSDTNVPKLLQELLKHCPSDFKKCFVEQKKFCWRFLWITFCRNDHELLREMFSYLNAARKVQLVFSEDVMRHFHRSLLEDKWQVVEVCLREAALSEKHRNRLKRVYTRLFGVNENTRRFFEFLDRDDV